jgi:alkylmercury lyase
LVELLKKWDTENNGISPEESTLAERFEIQALRLLADGHPVSAEQVFEQSQEVAGEWDEEGRLVGQALTLIPTQHRLRIRGNDLFAWCALDTMLVPGLVGDTAEIESPDPLTGELIRLTVAPSGVEEYDPDSAVLSVVLSGGKATGPESTLCSQMHFFASRESAERWQSDHADVAIMTVKKVDQLIHERVLAPMRKALAELS